MFKDIFYKYDFYTLEYRYDENEFIKNLDNEVSLNNTIEPFILRVINLLLTSIEENESAEIPKVDIPQIDKNLENILKGNFLYDAFIESNPENKLSEVVFKKFLNKIFKKNGLSDESYIIQGYIHAWLEKKLAFGIVNDSRFNSIDILVSLIRKTEMLHNFYIHLVNNIPKDWIHEKNWVTINANSENILESIRTFDNEYFESYVDLFNSADKTNLWNFISKVTYGSDYAMLNQKYNFISSVLIKNDKLLWIKFWDNLKFPIIQDCTFHSFINSKPQQYLELINVLVSEKVKLESDINVLLLIVAKNYFETSYKLTEKLSLYEDEDRKTTKNEHFFEKGKEIYREWLEEKNNYYKEFIENLQKKLNNADIDDWIFSYKPRIINSTYKPNDIYNLEIELLINTYKSCYNKPENLDFQLLNLQKFKFYVEVVRDSKDKHLAEKLLEAVVNFIESDNFFWDHSYPEQYLSSFEGIGYLISLHSDPLQKTNELIEKFKVNHQGWRSAKIDYKPLMKESFIYSGIALIFKYDHIFEDKSHGVNFFNDFFNIILEQNRYSQIDYSDYYQQTLYFLTLHKIFSDVKEYFEIKLIENYDNLRSLLYILSNIKGSICNRSKILLQERLDKELQFERRLFTNRGQIEIVRVMEKMIEDLNLKRA